MRYPAHLLLKETLRDNKPYFYLCKCAVQKNVDSYKGSGLVWLSVLKKYKSPVKTRILGTYDDHDSFKEAGRFYSELLNVVEDENFANLVPELGDGGWINDQTGKTWTIKDTSNMNGGQCWNDDIRVKEASERMKKENPMHSNDVRMKMSSTRKNNGTYKSGIDNPSAVALCLTFNDGTCIIATGKQLSSIIGISAAQISTLVNNDDRQRKQEEMILNYNSGKSKRIPACKGYIIRKVEICK
ncbi:hypothetical protein VPHK567_0338 [Vibrio phage K567]